MIKFVKFDEISFSGWDSNNNYETCERFELRNIVINVNEIISIIDSGTTHIFSKKNNVDMLCHTYDIVLDDRIKYKIYDSSFENVVDVVKYIIKQTIK